MKNDFLEYIRNNFRCGRMCNARTVCEAGRALPRPRG